MLFELSLETALRCKSVVETQGRDISNETYEQFSREQFYYVYMMIYEVTNTFLT